MKIDSPQSLGTSTGFGIPTGGTTNQVLVKNSTTNFDTSWQTRSPQYISVVKSTLQTDVGVNTDITWGSVEASSGLTLSSNSVTLTGGKVYQITGSFSVQNFSVTGSGYNVIGIYNSTNTRISNAVVALVTQAQTFETNGTMINIIYAPSTDTTIKFRVFDANGTVTYRDGFTNFTITEII